MAEIPKPILDILKRWFGKRRTQVLLLLVVGASITTYLVSHEPTYTQVLSVSCWCCVAGWYLWKTASDTPLQRKVTLVLLLICSGSCLYGIGFYLTSNLRQMAKLTKSAEERSDTGMFADAIRKYKEAISIAQASGDRTRETIYLCELGRAEVASSLQNEAEGHFESCRDKATELKNKKETGKAEVGLGYVAALQGNTDSARQHFGEAIGISDVEADARLGLGKLQAEDVQVDAALQNFVRALELYQKATDARGMVDTLIARGILNRSMGKYDDAKRDYVEAERVAQEHGYRFSRANAVWGLADIEFARQDLSSATDDFRKARGLYQAMGNRSGEGNAVRMLGDLEGTKGHYDAAIEYYNEALSAYQSQDDHLGIGAANAGLGRANGALGHFDVAHSYFAVARNAFLRAQDRRGEANVDFFDAATLERSGNAPAAFQMFRRAAELFEEIHLPDQAAMAKHEENRLQGNNPQ